MPRVRAPIRMKMGEGLMGQVGLYLGLRSVLSYQMLYEHFFLKGDVAL